MPSSNFAVSSLRPDDVRHVGHEPYQIVAPEKRTIRQCFADLIPTHPYCADDPAGGIQIRNRNEALRRSHVQFNGPYDVGWLLFDIDRRDARFAADDANLPPPTVVVVKRENGHAHLAYRLGRPVMKFPESRRAPLYFAAAIERGFVRRLGADPHYSGLIAKNPLHPEWCTTWLAEQAYDLPTLADWLFERDMRADPQPKFEFGLGRNCQVFDDLRAIAYRQVLTFKEQRAGCAGFAKRLEELALIINQQFARPLGRSEVRSIARSVAKWTWRQFSPERFSEIQSWRGRQTRGTTKIRMGIVDALADGDA